MATPFFKLVQGWEIGTRVITTEGYEDAHRLHIFAASALDAWKSFSLICEQETPLPALFTFGSFDLVSERFKDLSSSFSNALEFLPAQVSIKGERNAHNYWALHLPDRVDCIDYEKSDFDKYGEGEHFTAARFRKLVMQDEVINSLHIFGDRRYPMTYISQEFRSALLHHNLSVRSLPPEGAEAENAT